MAKDCEDGKLQCTNEAERAYFVPDSLQCVAWVAYQALSRGPHTTCIRIITFHAVAVRLLAKWPPICTHPPHTQGCLNGPDLSSSE